MIKRLCLLTALLTFTVILSSCSIINKDKDENVFYGTVEAEKINVSTEIPGEIREIKAYEGENIKIGQLVAVIDGDESKIKLDQSELGIKNAQNELAKVNEGSRQEEIKAQRAMVNQSAAMVKQGEAAVKLANSGLKLSQTNYDYKKKAYDNIKKLYENKAETESSLDNAKNQLDVAKNALENGKIAVENAKAQLSSFNAQEDATRAKLSLLLNGPSKETKTTAEYGIEQAKGNYNLSKVALSKNNIISRVEGTVETVNFNKGEYVSPGSSIITILDNKNMWVKIYVPEKSLPMLKLNKEVSMKSDFIKDKTIKGKIVYISPEAEFTPVNVVTKEDRMKLVFAVKVKILDNLEAVKPGMLLDVYVD